MSNNLKTIVKLNSFVIIIIIRIMGNSDGTVFKNGSNADM